MEKCAICKNRFYESWAGREPCGLWEEDKCDARDTKCSRYEPETEEEEEHYCPSATAGDYSPSSPWLAPGMSIHNFI